MVSRVMPGLQEHEDDLHISASIRQAVKEYLGRELTNEEDGKLFDGSIEEQLENLKQLVPGAYGKVIQNSIKIRLRNKILILVIQKKKDEATELLAKTIKEQQQIYSIRHDEKNEIWIYKDGIFVPEGQSYITEFCREMLDDAYTAQSGKRVVDKIVNDTFISSNDFFVNENPKLIPVQNGIIDLRDDKEIKLLPFSPKFRFFTKIKADYDPEKDCESIKKFFITVLPNEKDRNSLQEIFGYCMYREYFIHKAFIWLGGGRNGKGKTMELLKIFLGVENVCNISMQEIEEKQFIKHEFVNKLANLNADMGKGMLRQTSNFKSLVGGDQMTVERKFLRAINFTNHAKWITALNELPMTADLTDAFFERIQFLDFTEKFLPKEQIEKMDVDKRENVREANPNIINELNTPEEMSGLLNWSLEGLKMLLSREYFSDVNTAETIKDKWLRASSTFYSFASDKLKKDIYGSVPKDTLHQEYAIYCQDNNLMAETDKYIRNILERHYGAIERQQSLPKESDEQFSKRIRIWAGIRLGREDNRSIDEYTKR